MVTAPVFCAVDIPVKRIILYKHGLAYFERDGFIPAGQEAQLDFKTSEMNDVLKSFTIRDTSGGKVTDVRYDANEPIDQQLAKFPLRLGDREPMTAFLDRMKGAEIEIKESGQVATGTVMGARSVETSSDERKRVIREQVTLLLTSGDVTNIELDQISSFRFKDEQLQSQLRRYLETLSRGKSADRRSIYLDFDGNGARDLKISYVAPSAIWKSSYRLGLNGASSTLEGWAIVDNTTDQDWSNVSLSVVSGRPISFISLLDIPRYGKREIAELPEDRAAGPVVYGGALEGHGELQASRGGVIAGTGSGFGGGIYKLKAKNQVAAPRAAEVADSISQAASSVQSAIGATLGELFEYDFSAPVTIRKNESAMLPFLQQQISARKLLIYTDVGSEHPVNAAEIVNGTSKILDGGPITVYDGGAYAGEALFETLKAGDRRLIGYAVDYGTRITTAFDTGTQNLREVHVRNGNLELKYSTLETRTFTIRNVDVKPKTLLIEQAAGDFYSLISPKPFERGANTYRFEVKLPPSQLQTLKVEQEHVSFSTTEISNATPDFLLTITTNKLIDEHAREQLKEIGDLKQNIIEIQAAIAADRERSAEITADQSRLRQNIDSLNRVKGQEEQVRKYSSQLDSNETELAKLRDGLDERIQHKATLDQTLRAAINKLQL
jgi:hypothetical protein